MTYQTVPYRVASVCCVLWCIPCCGWRMQEMMKTPMLGESSDIDRHYSVCRWVQVRSQPIRSDSNRKPQTANPSNCTVLCVSHGPMRSSAKAHRNRFGRCAGQVQRAGCNRGSACCLLPRRRSRLACRPSAARKLIAFNSAWLRVRYCEHRAYSAVTRVHCTLLYCGQATH